MAGDTTQQWHTWLARRAADPQRAREASWAVAAWGSHQETHRVLAAWAGAGVGWPGPPGRPPSQDTATALQAAWAWLTRSASTYQRVVQTLATNAGVSYQTAARVVELGMTCGFLSPAGGLGLAGEQLLAYAANAETLAVQAAQSRGGGGGGGGLLQ